MTDSFNWEKGDDLPDLSGNAPAQPKAPIAPAAPYQAPTAFTSVAASKSNTLHTEPCQKCRGSGRFIGYTGRDFGPCFKCKGAGKLTFKSSAADRAKQRAHSAAHRETLQAQKQERTQQAAVAWQAAHPAAHRWMIDNIAKNSFAMSLTDSLTKYGSLTDGQLAAVERCITRDTERKATAQARADSAPAVDTSGVDRLKLAFDTAIKNAQAKATGLTIRHPKITIGGVTISPAKEGSKNPGALYVKAGQTYLGKIADGKFVASRECQPEQQAKVLSFLADPKAAAEAYGQETGVCCICNATLRSEWRLRGIGPICAEKFGF